VVNGKIEVDARVVDAGKGTAVCGMSSSGFDIANLRPLADDVVSKIRVK
jgi:hypothetical protein